MKNVEISLSEYLQSCFLVLLNLQNEIVYRVELRFWAKVFNEFDTHRLVVDVAFEVQDMNLNA